MKKRRPPKPHKKGVYDSFGSFAAVRNAYRRKRRLQHFILTDAAARRLDPICAVCQKHLSERPKGYDDGSISGSPWKQDFANRSEYLPKCDAIVIMHYVCAWSFLLDAIFKLGRKLY